MRIPLETRDRAYYLGRAEEARVIGETHPDEETAARWAAAAVVWERCAECAVTLADLARRLEC